jgi:aspartokinase/homoserine dehydrogenase 1
MNYTQLSTSFETQLSDNFAIGTDVPIGSSVLELIKSARSKDRQAKRHHHDRVKGARTGWSVHKFGGSSFADPDCYSFVGQLIDSFPGKNLIVVSALSGVTNLLYSICVKAEQGCVLECPEWKTLVSRVSEAIIVRLGDTLAREKEMLRFSNDLLYITGLLSFMPTSSPADRSAITSVVVGFGEIFSARLLTQIMRGNFHRQATFMDARDVLVVRPLSETSDDRIEVCWDVTRNKLKTWWINRKPCDVLIVTGFIARNLEDDLPVTLKRNGSDFSATIFSALSKAHSVTIWKDVDGMYTADPKKHADAKFIPYQTFEEAEEASFRGAFVLQKDCIEPARIHDIPIFLRNCLNLSCPGTRIGPPESEDALATDRIRTLSSSVGDQCGDDTTYINFVRQAFSL